MSKYILLILDGQIDEVKKWVSTNEFQQMLNDIEKLPLNFFDDFKLWDVISVYQTLSEQFMREFKNKVNWEGVSAHQELSDDFVLEFKDRLNWETLCRYRNLNSGLIDKCFDKVDWLKLECYQQLSEDILEKYFKCWRLDTLVQHQTNLPSRFIEKHWKTFSKGQGTVHDLLCFQKSLTPKMKRKLIRKEKEHLQNFIVSLKGN